MFNKTSTRSALVQIIVCCSLVRCVLALVLNLGNDEVYYFTYAVQPDWNHFDHPPLVGLFIRIFTFNLHWLNDLSMRLPAIAGAAINTWLIAHCAQKLGSEKGGLVAAILYNTSVYCSILSGLFILPDSVQLVFWLASLHTMLSMLDTDASTVSRNRNLLWLGCWIGLAIMSKVHGVFLWVGFAGFVFTSRLSWLKDPFLYVSLGITALILSPIFLWNIQNDFITWQFHSNRVAITDGINLMSLMATMLGQIAYNNPFNIALAILALLSLRRRETEMSPRIALLLWCSLPIIAATIVVSLFRPTLPHWSGPGFVGLILLSSHDISNNFRKSRRGLISRLVSASIGLMIFIVVAGLATVRYYPGTLGNNLAPNTGAGDATLDIYGWEQLLPEFRKIRLEDMRTPTMTEEAPLVVHKWFPGAHLYYYVAFPLGMNVRGMGTLHDLHKFVWLNDMNPPLSAGSCAYFISPSNNFTDPSVIYKNQFDSIELAAKIPCRRNGKLARYWYVFRLKGLLK